MERLHTKQQKYKREPESFATIIFYGVPIEFSKFIFNNFFLHKGVPVKIDFFRHFIPNLDRLSRFVFEEPFPLFQPPKCDPVSLMARDIVCILLDIHPDLDRTETNVFLCGLFAAM